MRCRWRCVRLTVCSDATGAGTGASPGRTGLGLGRPGRSGGRAAFAGSGAGPSGPGRPGPGLPAGRITPPAHVLSIIGQRLSASQASVQIGIHCSAFRAFSALIQPGPFQFTFLSFSSFTSLFLAWAFHFSLNTTLILIRLPRITFTGLLTHRLATFFRLPFWQFDHFHGILDHGYFLPSPLPGRLVQAWPFAGAGPGRPHNWGSIIATIACYTGRRIAVRFRYSAVQ